MKRFTDTDKWFDPWFRKLSSPAKQLWGYLLDRCDKIGLIEIDFALISADCGQQINQSHLEEIGNRVEATPIGKYFIPKFINFQYGILSDSCPPHRRILDLIKLHNLQKDGLLYHYPSLRVEEKKGMEEDKKRGSAEGEIPHEPPKSTRFVKPTEAEILLQCAKTGLPNDEGRSFLAYYESNGWRVGKNPMRSWPHALQNWKKNFDQRRFEQSPNGKHPSIQSPSLIDKIIKSI